MGISQRQFRILESDGTVQGRNKTLMDNFQADCSACKEPSLAAIVIGVSNDGKHIHIGCNYGFPPEVLHEMLMQAAEGIAQQADAERRSERKC